MCVYVKCIDLNNEAISNFSTPEHPLLYPIRANAFSKLRGEVAPREANSKVLIGRHLVVVRVDQRRDSFLNRAHLDECHLRVLEKFELDYLAMRSEQVCDDLFCRAIWNVAEMKHVTGLVNVLVVLATLLSESVQVMVGIILGQVVRVLRLIFGKINFLVLGKLEFHLAASKLLVVQVLERDASLLGRGKLDKRRVALLV